MSLGAPVQFDVRTPCSDAVIREHVISALARGLPEMMPAPHPRAFSHLKIIASGPSARQADLSGATLAVNNALQMFADQGKSPTYWAGCDPQAALADFLKNPPAQTIYYVASKCHPDVFDALKDRKVIVWHVEDEGMMDLMAGKCVVMSCCSITLTSIPLMNALGFETFETWGWDGCYVDGRSHVNDQIHAGQNITVEVMDGPDAGRQFQTTTNWALEAQDAADKLHLYTVDIKGDGFIAARVRHVHAQRQAA